MTIYSIGTYILDSTHNRGVKARSITSSLSKSSSQTMKVCLAYLEQKRWGRMESTGFVRIAVSPRHMPLVIVNFTSAQLVGNNSR